MSEVAALEPFGEFHSALYFRDLYLRDEVVFDEFFCPFCGVPLDTALIYKPADHEMGQSPHFRTKRNGDKHYPGCDGNPSNYQHPQDKGPSRTHIEKQPFTLPTEFAEYIERPPRPTGNRSTRIPTPEEILRRRDAAGRIYGTARFRVSLVQSIAEAHLAVLGEAYRRRDAEGWSNEQFNKWVRSVLDASLNLRGYATTYNRALHDLHFPIAKHERIYLGRDAKVQKVPGGYEILSTRPGKDDAGTVEHPFVIVVAMGGVDADRLRGARAMLARQLSRASEENVHVRWYAFGKPVLANERFQLRIAHDNLGDLFVKSYFPKTKRST